MIKYSKYVAGVFVIALFVSAIESTPVYAGADPHDGLDQICLCFGPRSNGFNATNTQLNGQCAASQTGPFCFVDTALMPLFWKVYEFNENTVELGINEKANLGVQCPQGKMVLSCGGGLLDGEGNDFTDVFIDDISHNVRAVPGTSNEAVPKVGCRIDVQTDDDFDATVTLFVWAFCASPGPM